MKITIDGDLVTSGFAVPSKIGVRLFVNTRDKRVMLESSSSCNKGVEFHYVTEGVENWTTIRFEAETPEEVEWFTDVYRYECFCKQQHEFIFIKWSNLDD